MKLYDWFYQFLPEWSKLHREIWRTNNFIRRFIQPDIKKLDTRITTLEQKHKTYDQQIHCLTIELNEIDKYKRALMHLDAIIKEVQSKEVRRIYKKTGKWKIK